mmetsp:Transcript_24690/g.51663  ORF Transcript_24690/g.51663 Transcript_24690/m.51663 type:complete len:352 (+) Transcript_24690:201-1256(+)
MPCGGPRIHNQSRKSKFLTTNVHRIPHCDDGQQHHQQQRNPHQLPQVNLQRTLPPRAPRRLHRLDPTPLLQRVPPEPIVRARAHRVEVHPPLRLPGHHERAGHRTGRHARHWQVVHLRKLLDDRPLLEVVEGDGSLDGTEREEGAVRRQGGGGDRDGGTLDSIFPLERRRRRRGRGRCEGGGRRSRGTPRRRRGRRPMRRNHRPPPGQIRRTALPARHGVHDPPLQIPVRASPHQDLRRPSHHPRIPRLGLGRIGRDRGGSGGIVHLALQDGERRAVPGVEDAGGAVLGAAEELRPAGVEVDGADRLGVSLAFGNFREFERKGGGGLFVFRLGQLEIDEGSVFAPDCDEVK